MIVPILGCTLPSIGRIKTTMSNEKTKININKVISLEEASKIVKEISFTKFDASIDLDVRLGVDPKKADQMVRGNVSLPHGTGKEIKVL